MSMPQPIHVALVGRTAEVVRRAKKHFRLSAPGIGAAYLVTLDPVDSDSVLSFEDLPPGRITFWVALDGNSLSASRKQHQIDRMNPNYSRGFYEQDLPEPCVLVDFDKPTSASQKQLADLAEKVVEAWYASS